MVILDKVTEIKHFNSKDLKPVASVLAKAMLHNPLHLAIFGAADQKSEIMQTRMFTDILRSTPSNLFVAYRNGKMVGVMNYYKPGCCKINPLISTALLPKMASTLGTKVVKVLKWKTTWSRYDPQTSHLHFGPLAVLPEMQGRGIGSTLLAHFCVLADIQDAPSHLETDKENNVLLYETYGFRVIAETELFGVKNWFMWREKSSKSR